MIEVLVTTAKGTPSTQWMTLGLIHPFTQITNQSNLIEPQWLQPGGLGLQALSSEAGFLPRPLHPPSSHLWPLTGNDAG